MVFALEHKYLALGKESPRGTAVAPTRYIAIGLDSEFDYKLNLIEDELIRGILERFPAQAGTKDGTARITGMDVTSLNCGELLLSLLGVVTSTEQNMITVSASNKKFDFDIGGGELTATIVEGSYPIGTTQAGAGTFCKALYDAIVAAEPVGTYTVTYSRTTNKFTITRSAGTFSILWKTGTNTATNCATIMGYSKLADDTGSLSYASDTTVDFAMKHVFTKSTDIQNQSYTFHLERKLSQKQYPLSVVKLITLTGAVDGKLLLDSDVLFKTEEAEGFSLSPSWVDPKPFMFYQTKVKFDTVENVTAVRDWTLTIDNGSIIQRVLSGSQDVKDILTFAKLLGSGTMNIFFEDEVQRAKFLANTAVALDIEMTGALIGGSIYNKLLISLPQIHYTAYPFGNLDGLLGAAVAFNAYYKVASAKSVQIELTNNIASY